MDSKTFKRSTEPDSKKEEGLFDQIKKSTHQSYTFLKDKGFNQSLEDSFKDAQTLNFENKEVPKLKYECPYRGVAKMFQRTVKISWFELDLNIEVSKNLFYLYLYKPSWYSLACQDRYEQILNTMFEKELKTIDLFIIFKETNSTELNFKLVLDFSKLNLEKLALEHCLVCDQLRKNKDFEYWAQKMNYLEELEKKNLLELTETKTEDSEIKKLSDQNNDNKEPVLNVQKKHLRNYILDFFYKMKISLDGLLKKVSFCKTWLKKIRFL